MEFRWQPNALTVLTELRDDSTRGWMLDKVADTLHALTQQLPTADGDGHLWIEPIEGTDWVIACSNDQPHVLVVTYLGPALG